MIKPSVDRRAVAIAASAVVFVGALVQGCGPLLTVGGLVGVSTLDEDEKKNARPIAAVTDPTGVLNDVIEIRYRLSDAESDRTNVIVEYGSGGGFSPASQAFEEGAEGTENLTASPTSEDHVFLWNSAQDLGFSNTTGLQIRITPVDASETDRAGLPVTTEPFDVLNEYITTLAQRPSQVGISALGIGLRASGDMLLADTLGHRVLSVDRTTGEAQLLAGTGVAGYNGDGVLGTEAQVNGPSSIQEVPLTGDVLFADSSNGLIRQIDQASGFITGVAGEGGDFDEGVLAIDAGFFPRDLALDSSGNPFLTAEARRIRAINLQGVSPLTLPRGTSCTAPPLPATFSVAAGRIQTVVSADEECVRTGLGAPTLDNATQVAFWQGTPPLLYVLELGPLNGGKTNQGIDGATNPYPRITVVNYHSATVAFEAPVGGSVDVAEGDRWVVLDGSLAALPDLHELSDLALLGSHLLAFSTFRTNEIYALNLSSVSQTVVGTTVPAGSFALVAGTGTAALTGDGLAPLAADLFGPVSLGADGLGNLYLAEQASRVRVLTGSSGLIFGGQTIGPNTVGSIPVIPPGTVPGVTNPLFATLTPSGDLLVTDIDSGDPRSNRVFRVSARDASVSVVAGNGTFGDDGDGGPAEDARLGAPLIASTDASDTLVVFADATGNRLRVTNRGTQSRTILGVTVAPGEIEALAGTGARGFSGDGGPPLAAEFDAPTTAVFDAAGLLWIGDTGNFRIRVCNPTTQAVTVAGVAVAPGTIQTVIGTGVQGTLGDDGDGGPASAARLLEGSALIGSDGNVYVVDGDQNARIRVVNRQSTPITLAGVTIAPGAIDTVVGSGLARLGDNSNLGDGGPATDATFRTMTGVSIRSDGLLFVSDSRDHRIRVVNTGTATVTLGGVALAPGTIETLIGTGLPGFSGGSIPFAGGFFQSPGAGEISQPNIPLALNDGRLFFVDQGNGGVRMANLSAQRRSFGGISADSGEVVLVAGSRSGLERVGTPQDLGVDNNGTVLFSDSGALENTATIKALDPTTRIVTLVAGTVEGPGPGAGGFTLGDGGPAQLANLSNPKGLHVEGDGSIYVADAEVGRIRFINRSTSTRAPVMGASIPAGHIDTVVNGANGNGDPDDDDGLPILGPPGSTLDLFFPVSVSAAGNAIWIADQGSSRIVRVNTTTALVEGTQEGILLSSGVLLADPWGTTDESFLPDADTDFTTLDILPGDFIQILGTTGGAVDLDGIQIVDASGTVVNPPALFQVSVAPSGGAVPSGANQLGIDGVLSMAAGVEVVFLVARLGNPTAVVARDGDTAYVGYQTFTGGSMLLEYDYLAGFTVTRVGGSPDAAWNGDYLQALDMNFGQISGLHLEGDLLWIADSGTHRVVAVNTGLAPLTVTGLQIDPGEARMICGAGTGQPGFNGDALPPRIAELSSPTGVAVGGGGVFVADQGNGRLRRFQR